jgi:hypothetical protein
MDNTEDHDPIVPPTEPEDSQPVELGLRRLLVLMIVGGVLLLLLDRFVVPAPVGVGFRIVMAGYFMMLTAYAVLRVPQIWRAVGPGSPRWRRVRQKRKELEVLAARLRDRQP